MWNIYVKYGQNFFYSALKSTASVPLKQLYWKHNETLIAFSNGMAFEKCQVTKVFFPKQKESVDRMNDSKISRLSQKSKQIDPSYSVSPAMSQTSSDV